MPTRRKFLTQSSLTLGAVGFLKPLQALAGTAPDSQQQNTLTILYTNGFNGNLGDATTGISAVNDLVKEIRCKAKNILLLDSGNILQTGSAKSLEDLHFYKTMKATGYDVITPGIADMQHGSDYFAKLVERSHLPAVAANHKANEMLTGDRIFRKGGLRIGVIGVGGNNEINGGSMLQLMEAVNVRAERMKEIHQCQLVVLLSHLLLKNSETGCDNFSLAAASTHIDVVISAQDERFTYNTHVLKNSCGQDVVLTHAGKEGSMLGKLDIRFNESGEKIGFATEQVFAGSSKKESSLAFRRHAASQMA